MKNKSNKIESNQPERVIYYQLMKFPIGWLGICGSSQGLSKIQLPEKTKAETKKKLLSLFTKNKKIESIEPVWMIDLKTQLHKFFSLQKYNFMSIPLDIKTTAFQNRVYTILQKTPPQKIYTYKTLADKVGAPNASRAIGNAMSKNPTPIVIPCHRVISSSSLALQKIGGFSAYDGIKLKRKLLEFDSIEL